MKRYTGPAIPTKGSHIHAIEGMLGVENDLDYTYWNPGSYEIGARSSKELIDIPKHVRSWPRSPEFELDVEAHTRRYPDIGASTYPVPHYEIGASTYPVPHYEVGASTFPVPHYEVGAGAAFPSDPYEIGYEIGAGAAFPSDPYEIGLIEIGAEEIGAFSRSFDADPPRLTGKVKYTIKEGKIITCAEVYIPSTKTCILVSIVTPLKPIEKMLKKAIRKGATLPQVAAMFGLDESDLYEVGGLWGSLKRGARGISRAAKTVGKKVARKALKHTIKSPAFKKVLKKASIASRYVARGAKKVAQNPYVQKFAQVAAVTVATSFGIPPNITMASTGVLFDAINGDGVAMDKIANISQMAAEGYPEAKKMKALMGLLYKGGMKDMKPYLEQAQQAAEASFTKATAQLRTQAARALPSVLRLPGKPPGMFPFNIPGLFGQESTISGWLYNVPYRAKPSDVTPRSLYQGGMQEMIRQTSEPKVEGWFYNVPYRSNLGARELDVFGKGRNPFHLLRGAYNQGMDEIIRQEKEPA